MIGDDSDEEEGENVLPAAREYSLEDDAPECIFCREKSGEAIGYLAFLQQSSVTKRALEQHSDCKEMQSVYRVVSLRGCSVTANPSESSRVITHFPQGKHLLISHRSGRYMRVVSPTAGWVPLYRNLPVLPKTSECTASVRAAALSQPERHQRLSNTHEGGGAGAVQVKAALEVCLCVCVSV